MGEAVTQRRFRFLASHQVLKDDFINTIPDSELSQKSLFEGGSAAGLVGDAIDLRMSKCTTRKKKIKTL